MGTNQEPRTDQQITELVPRKRRKIEEQLCLNGNSVLIGSLIRVFLQLSRHQGSFNKIKCSIQVLKFGHLATNPDSALLAKVLQLTSRIGSGSDIRTG